MPIPIEPAPAQGSTPSSSLPLLQFRHHGCTTTTNQLETITAYSSLQQAMVVAVEAGDDEGLALLAEITAAQLGHRATTAALCELPALVSTSDVPAALQMIHGPSWKQAARDVLIDAAYGLSRVGVQPGRDISLMAASDGTPTLLMAKRVHHILRTIAPQSFHLIGSFLQVE